MPADVGSSPDRRGSLARLGSAMIFLPSSCDSCRTIGLISYVDRISGQGSCASCGGTVTVLPAAAYPEGDVLLFNELLTLSEGSGVFGLEAEQLATAIESARSSFDEPEALRVAGFHLAGLGTLAPLLGAIPGRARQALSMLDTILRALAKAERPSRSVRRSAAIANLKIGNETAHWQDVAPLSRTWRQNSRSG